MDTDQYMLEKRFDKEIEHILSGLLCCFHMVEFCTVPLRFQQTKIESILYVSRSRSNQLLSTADKNNLHTSKLKILRFFKTR